jgi:hypothetical protein
MASYMLPLAYIPVSACLVCGQCIGARLQLYPVPCNSCQCCAYLLLPFGNEELINSLTPALVIQVTLDTCRVVGAYQEHCIAGRSVILLVHAPAPAVAAVHC